MKAITDKINKNQAAEISKEKKLKEMEAGFSTEMDAKIKELQNEIKQITKPRLLNPIQPAENSRQSE